VIPAVLLGLVVAATPAESTYHVPPVDPGIFLFEASGAVVGGAACAAGLGFLLTRLYDPSEDVWKSFGGTVLGGSLGYPLFCGVGCYAAGRLVRQPGRLHGAVIGALAATPIAITMAWTAAVVEKMPPGSVKSSPIYVIALLVPPAGAVVGYNLTLPATGQPGAGRRVRPELGLGAEPRDDGGTDPVLRFGLGAGI
jgi:hypothetical protein